MISITVEETAQNLPFGGRLHEQLMVGDGEGKFGRPFVDALQPLPHASHFALAGIGIVVTGCLLSARCYVRCFSAVLYLSFRHSHYGSGTLESAL